MIKRLFDLVFVFAGLVLNIPLFLIVATLIRLDSPGPVFYRSPRVGKDGKVFKLFMFRTMTGPQTGYSQKLTRVGRFLRNRSLDHWPTLINVLSGEMSVVGPRPEIPKFVDLANEQ